MTLYTEQEIDILTDIQHVRNRVSMYLGSNNKSTFDIPQFGQDQFTINTLTFVPATYQAIKECLDNINDEFIHHRPKHPEITIIADCENGTYQISDNGRGIPIGTHRCGLPTPQVVFGTLRSGRNFKNDNNSGIIGMNGMGVSLTQICSCEFIVNIKHNRQHYFQKFVNANPHKCKIIKQQRPYQTGTCINFTLDATVFEDIKLPIELLTNKAIEIAASNPGVVVNFNDQQFVYDNGFIDLINKYSQHYFTFENEQMQFYVIFDVNIHSDIKIFTYVNSSLLLDGGICNSQFINSLCSLTREYLTKDAKKHKCEITNIDIKHQLLIIGNIKIANPQYDSQSKTRLTGPNIRKQINQLIELNWKKFTKHGTKWLNDVLNRSIIRCNVSNTKQIIKQYKKTLTSKIPGLIDATNKDRTQCSILITEGESAASMITQARNPKLIASLPLTGKINNVYGCSISQLLKMSKISNLLKAIRLIPGQLAKVQNIRYGKIIIATDADVDGGDIFTLLINLFYHYWPELFEDTNCPIVYRLIAPNVCVYNKQERIHFATMQQYIDNKHKYDKNYNVNYYKGLGSMIDKDWDMILNGTTNTLIPIVTDDNFKSTLQLLFGPDTNQRKTWLQ